MYHTHLIIHKKSPFVKGLLVFLYIRNILNTRKRVNFIELFTEVTKENIVVTFLSILEMTKSNEILLTQEDNFSPIMIERA